ncbi:alpha/beta hydrolase-fold protein [Phaeocystidibacter marisrubri]|uniref:Alpha/beta hydrolase fold domain-containing protein n=1 Tax=Phaeocystidibacter marisrubri TaxID=1577780 RepID=A0A6L3ZJ30_9FLAO|nr:alpha/beta hydrolase-fold protein [Phaeocystidibacter marisrubri]KAB2817445.1 alpha/beta hydrolase fold domain-containing protein [Phaeocystidibacter marisrubri]
MNKLCINFGRLWLFMLMVGAMSCSKSTITVEIQVEDTSGLKPDSVYIVGNTPELGNWNPAITLMEKVDDYYVFTLEMKKEESIEFKFTLGDWAKEGMIENGDGGNIVLSPKTDTSVVFSVKSWHRPEPTSTAVGNVFQWNVADPKGELAPRKLHIYLPKNYERDSTATYPVLYMMDGQNLFDERFSTSMGEWGIDEYLESDTASKVIVVGVENSVNRMEEYMDYVKGKPFREWLAHFIFPKVDSAFRTDTNRRFVGGSSAGGALAYMMRREYGRSGRNRVDGVLCFSPALYVNTEEDQYSIFLADELESRPYPRVPIYFDIGGKGVDRILLEGTEMLKKHYPENSSASPVYKYVVDLNDDHNETAWRKRFPAALEWLLANDRN